MSAAAILIASQQSEIQNATGNAGAGVVIAILLLGGLACATVAVLSDEADGVRLSRRGTRRALGAAALVAVLAPSALHAPISRGWDQFTHSGNVASGSTARFTSLGGDRYAYWRAAYHAFESDPGRGIGPGSFEFYWSRNGTTDQLDSQSALALPAEALRARAGRLRRDRSRARGAALGSDRGPPPMDQRKPTWLREAACSPPSSSSSCTRAWIGCGRWGRSGPWPWAAPLSSVPHGSAGLHRSAAGRVPGSRCWRSSRRHPWCPRLSQPRERGPAERPWLRAIPARAVQLADDAIRAEPWAASPYAQKALALQAEGRLTEARDEINRAIDHERTNWRWLLIRAQINARAGDVNAARVDLVHAKSLAPRSPYLQPNSSFVRDVLGAQPSAQSQLGG